MQTAAESSSSKQQSKQAGIMYGKLNIKYGWLDCKAAPIQQIGWKICVEWK